MTLRSKLLFYALFLFLFTGPACVLASPEVVTAPRPRPLRIVLMPGQRVAPAGPAGQAAQAAIGDRGRAEAQPAVVIAATPSPAPIPALVLAETGVTDPATNLAYSFPTVTPWPILVRACRLPATPTSWMRDRLVSGLVEVFDSDTPTPTRTPLPSLTPTPAETPTPTATSTATPTATSSATATPTNTPTPTQTASPTRTPSPTATPPPTNTPTSTPIPPPTATPLPEYDFMLAEFFNSPTSNSFLLIYVAIVDIKEIPIGGMKIVGTRENDNLTYESPLSTWHYEGYNAPAHVIKTGNVKFEPPGGLETTGWRLYLADAHGQRMSADIPFEVDQENPQWYFIKFRRKF
jgi:hypothetical protein